MRFPVVLFDLDGTLIDSGPIILASMRHAYADRARPRDPGRGARPRRRRPGPDRADAADRPRPRRRARRGYRAHNEPLHADARGVRGHARRCCRRSSDGGPPARDRDGEAAARPSGSRSIASCRSSSSSTSSSAPRTPSGTSRIPTRSSSRSACSAPAGTRRSTSATRRSTSAPPRRPGCTRSPSPGAGSTRASGSSAEEPDAVVATAGGAPCRPLRRSASAPRELRRRSSSTTTTATTSSTTRRSPDADYDRLFDELKALEEEHPELVDRRLADAARRRRRRPTGSRRSSTSRRWARSRR